MAYDIDIGQAQATVSRIPARLAIDTTCLRRIGSLDRERTSP
jgi:hypothetical protein